MLLLDILPQKKLTSVIYKEVFVKMDVFREIESYFEQSMPSPQGENMDNEELMVFPKSQVSDGDETETTIA